MQKYITRALLGALVLSGACKEGLSAPSQDALVAGTQQPVQNLVTGILATDRGQASAFSYLLYGETMARNSARIDPNEPRYINELIAVPIDNSDFIGSSGWTNGFQTARASNQLLTGRDARRDGARAIRPRCAVSCRRSRRWTTSESCSCAIRLALRSRATIRRRSIHSERRVPCSRTSRRFSIPATRTSPPAALMRRCRSRCRAATPDERRLHEDGESRAVQPRPRRRSGRDARVRPADAMLDVLRRRRSRR